MKVGPPQLSDRGAPTLKNRKTLDTTNSTPTVTAALMNRAAPIPSSKRKASTGILVTPAIATVISVSPGINFESSNDQEPILANTSSVRRTQKSGEKDSLQSSPKKRCP